MKVAVLVTPLSDPDFINVTLLLLHWLKNRHHDYEMQRDSKFLTFINRPNQIKDRTIKFLEFSEKFHTLLIATVNYRTQKIPDCTF